MNGARSLGLAALLFAPEVLAQTPMGSRPEVTGRKGMVTSNHPLASTAGFRLLLQGGNAFDDAVATAAATSVVDPFNSSLGGNGFATVYVAKSREVRGRSGRGSEVPGRRSTRS
jgi:gamma-glutamyltranspeptidase